MDSVDGGLAGSTMGGALSPGGGLSGYWGTVTGHWGPHPTFRGTGGLSCLWLDLKGSCALRVCLGGCCSWGML